MDWVIEAEGYRAWFVVKSNKGIIRTGLVGNDFTISVVDKDDFALSTPTPSESAKKSGLYTFLVPSSFLVTNGSGQYAVVIEINATGPKLDDVRSIQLKVTKEDVDTLGKVLKNRTETNPTTGVMTLYDDDDSTPFLTCPIYEDIAAAQPYRGQGIDRRNRLA